MDFERHLEIIDHESLLLRQAATEAGPNAAVPPCPGWIMTDLVDHIAGVQLWCADTVANGAATKRIPLEPAEESLGRFAEATERLLATFRAADPAAVCAAIPGVPRSSVAAVDHDVAYWARRQACEIVVHRADADLANGQTPTLDADVAVDVIDEWVHEGLARLVLADGVDAASLTGDVHLHCTDVAGEWTFEMADGRYNVVDEHRKATAALKGPASDLALWVNDRVRNADVEAFGDVELLERWITIGSM